MSNKLKIGRVVFNASAPVFFELIESLADDGLLDDEEIVRTTAKLGRAIQEGAKEFDLYLEDAPPMSSRDVLKAYDDAHFTVGGTLLVQAIQNVLVGGIEEHRIDLDKMIQAFQAVGFEVVSDAAGK